MRISENQSVGFLVDQMQANKAKVDQSGREMSSGLKVFEPADTRQSASIVRFQDATARLEGHTKRLASARAQLGFQEQVLDEASNLITRAREIAQQLANESNSVEVRAQVVGEVWALRNQMATLANSTYQGRYIYGGIDDDDPPFEQNTTTYNPFGSNDSQIRYEFDNYDPPPTITNPPDRQIQIDDTTSIRISTDGGQVFTGALAALEKLGRALEGYRTDEGVPDYSAYTFPADYDAQTEDILEALDALETARVDEIEPERSSIAERQRRIDTAENVLSFTLDSNRQVLSSLRDADITESATNLTLGQTALQASYRVTSQLLNLSILNFI
jgi:flagellar hook-associated protein 3 FlgL